MRKNSTAAAVVVVLSRHISRNYSSTEWLLSFDKGIQKSNAESNVMHRKAKKSVYWKQPQNPCNLLSHRNHFIDISLYRSTPNHHLVCLLRVTFTAIGDKNIHQLVRATLFSPFRFSAINMSTQTVSTAQNNAHEITFGW